MGISDDVDGIGASAAVAVVKIDGVQIWLAEENKRRATWPESHNQFIWVLRKDLFDSQPAKG
jgi:hypothetical protein